MPKDYSGGSNTLDSLRIMMVLMKKRIFHSSLLRAVMQIDENQEAPKSYEKIFPAEIFLTENFGKEAGFERKNITNNLIQ